jgi:hypothetical protein
MLHVSWHVFSLPYAAILLERYESSPVMSKTLAELIDKAMMKRLVFWLLMCLAVPLYIFVAYLYNIRWQQSATALTPVIKGMFFVGGCALAAISLITYRHFLSDRRLKNCLHKKPDVDQLKMDVTFGKDGEDTLQRIYSLNPWELRLLAIPRFLLLPLVVCTSLNNTIALLGLILSLLTHTFHYSFLFAAATLVLNGFVFPRINPLIDRANKMREEHVTV